MLTPELPQWWTEQIASAWSRARTASLDDWRVHGDHSTPLEGSILEHALAFGHGARMAYPDRRTWEALSGQLRSDWQRLGNVGTGAWELVAAAIRHEWRRAAGPAGDAAPAAHAERTD